MKALIFALALITSGCAAHLKPEDASKIDNNFSVVQSVLKGMDERLKKLEAPQVTATPRPGR